MNSSCDKYHCHQTQQRCFSYLYVDTECMMSVCKACGSKLETHEIQMRSADEPQTEVTSCPNCPVDPDKLNPDYSPRTPVKAMKRLLRRSMPQIPLVVDDTKNSYAISFDIPQSHDLTKVPLQSHHLIQRSTFHSRRASDNTGSKLLSAFGVIQGPFQGSSMMHESSRVLGAGVTLDTYTILGLFNNSSNNAMIRGFYHVWDQMRKYDAYVYSDYGSKNRRLIIDLGYDNPSSSVLKSVICYVYNMGIIFDSISRYIGLDLIARLGNLAGRAWDASSTPVSDHLFTCKPDGQRIWLVWIGSVWYACKPRCEKGITEWIWSDTINYGKPVVLDAEDMRSHGNIFIDCLTDNHGNPSPVSRDILWCLTEVVKIQELSPEIRIQVRKYFDHHKDAFSYCSQVPYPTDGIVAIRNGSTEILKIKSTRSMELVLKDDGMLCTSENLGVIRLPYHISRMYESGSILEVRFTIPQSTSLSISDVFQRVDKSNANSTEAISNILKSANSVLTPDDNERRVALLWCNNLRRDLYQSALSLPSNRSIVVDLGTGTGQSLDSVPDVQFASYVFVEPDKERCRSMSRRLGNVRILTVHDIPSMVKTLKTRAVSRIVVNCFASDILNDERISDALFKETRCITCVFSMQYMVKELHYISSYYDIPVFGCGYTYDAMPDSGTLVDSCGVLMRSIDRETASVKWGRDKEYTEPVTHTKDYTGIGEIVAGSDIRALPNNTVSPGANAICRHVSCIIPIRASL